MNTSPSLSPPGSDLDGLVKRLSAYARAFDGRDDDWPFLSRLLTQTASLLLSERALRERVEGERDEAILLMSQYARDLGEMEGRYKAAHWPGIVDDWHARAEAAEHRSSQLKAELKRRDDALRNPPKHDYWRAGEPDCPKDIKAGNGELLTLRCKRCGLTSPRDQICRANSEPQGGKR